MKLVARSLFLVLLLPALGVACIWDSDTLLDELQGRSTAWHVISGRVPEHGRAYYEKRLERSLGLLERAPESLEVLYDVAGAYMRLGEHDKAIGMLERADGISPDRYKTLSNLGVAYYLKGEASKKAGDYESALAYTKRALAKRADAHFGSGWLFEKLIAWRVAGSPQATTFLGTPHDQWKASVRNLAVKRAKAQGATLDDDTDHLKPLVTLLRAHPDFADGYLVLALNLHGEWNLNLALWAYVRALDMGHPQKALIEKQIDSIFKHWKELFELRQQKKGQRLMSKEASLAVIRKELAEGARWLARFQEVEAATIAATGDLPDFAATLEALEAKGVSRGTPKPAGLVGGSGAKPGSPARSAHEAQGPRQGMNDAQKVRDAKEAKSDAPKRAPGKDAPPVGGK